ncbi:unnamed protein product [Closterium sp. NIES-65]|nr:unnamed protein product [Closterium sp. NIES-65]
MVCCCSASPTDLSEPIDLFSEWIDEAERVNAEQVQKVIDSPRYLPSVASYRSATAALPDRGLGPPSLTFRRLIFPTKRSP